MVNMQNDEAVYFYTHFDQEHSANKLGGRVETAESQEDSQPAASTATGPVFTPSVNKKKKKKKEHLRRAGP